jgi:hypothetical protein
MSNFKSRKFKHLKKQRKNKTKHLKNKHRNTLKQARPKLFRKTKNYNNARQYLGNTRYLIGGVNEPPDPPYPPSPFAPPPPAPGFSETNIAIILGVCTLLVLLITLIQYIRIRITDRRERERGREREREREREIEIGRERERDLNLANQRLIADVLGIDLETLLAMDINDRALFMRDRTDPPRALPPRQPVTGINIEPDDVCSICQQPLTEDIVIALPCRHKFHNDCLENGLIGMRNNCPNCRDLVTTIGVVTQSVGGTNSLLDTLSDLVATVDIDVLTKTLMTHFYFLKLEPNDYEAIVELLQTINQDGNLEKLITILARGLGFSCTKTYDQVELTANKSDKKLAKILGTNGESTINAILQNCTSVNDLNLSDELFKDAEFLKNLLTKILSSGSKPNETLLLNALQLSRTTLNRILKRNN